MLGDLLVVRQCAQLRKVELDGVGDQSVDPQSVVGEVAVKQRLVLVGVRVLPVVPEVRRDVGLAVLAGFGVDVLEQVLQRSDDRLADALHDAGMADRERRRRDPPGDATTIEAANTQNPIQLSSVRPA